MNTACKFLLLAGLVGCLTYQMTLNPNRQALGLTSPLAGEVAAERSASGAERRVGGWIGESVTPHRLAALATSPARGEVENQNTLVSAAVAQAPPPLKKADEKPVVVPFELLKSRHMAVEVKINGNGPYRLIFDTGAPTNLINNKLAKEAGVLKKDDKPAFPLFGMGGAKTIDTLEIGGVKLEKVPTIVMDHPTVTAISKALGPIDGIVGFPFFARYKTTVDYQKKELTFVPNGFVPGDVMEGMMEKLMSGSRGKPEPRIVAPSAAWGFTLDDKDAKDESEGVTVKDVIAGSAAAEGGLKPGDRLLTLDGRWTDSVADTFIAASLVKPGRPVVLVVKRDGKQVKLNVKPAKGT